MNPPAVAPLPPIHAPARTLLPAPLRHRLAALLQGPPRGPRSQRKEACVFALGRIGDFVLVLPVLRLLVREYGADQVTLVIPGTVMALAVRELPGTELILLPSDAPGLLRDVMPLWWRERHRFAALRFKRRIVLTHFRPLYHDIVASWAEADRDYRLNPALYPAPTADDQCRELHAHRLLAATVLGRPISGEEIVPHLNSFTPGNDGRLLVYPISHDGTRDLPPDRLLSILRAWRERCATPWVLGGAPRDEARLEALAAAARAAGIPPAAIETPSGIIAFVSHIAAAGAVLSADSAAAHLGNALDKPTVVLTVPAWHGISQPWRKSARQHGFLMDSPAEAIASALPTLHPL